MQSDQAGRSGGAAVAPAGRDGSADRTEIGTLSVEVTVPAFRTRRWPARAVGAAALATIALATGCGPQRQEQQPVPGPMQPAPPHTAPPHTAPSAPHVHKPPVPDKPPEGVLSCPNQPGRRETAGADGRMLGHLPYREAPSGDLVRPPEGFATGSCTRLHADAGAALDAMLAAARAEDPAIADAMVGLSCFRSIKRQADIFCSKPQLSFAERAEASAPPGFSEHATGYAIDFGDRTRPECDLEACFAETPVGQWLAANAPRFGFVLSFPSGNSQGVMYEPWHWRFEGTDKARATFAQARD